MPDYSSNYAKAKPYEDYFNAQTQLVWQLISLVEKHGRPKRLAKLDALLFALLSHSGSIVQLLRSAAVPEAYLISRSFFEKCVNYCYLNVCSEDQYDNQLSWTRQKMLRALYTRQKAYKNIERDIPLPEISEFLKINKDLEKFTGKRGGEKPNWTEVPIHQRIRVIKESVDGFPNEMYLLTMNVVYEYASEVAHGTLYGALFHVDVFWGKKGSLDDNVKRLVSMSMDLLFFLGYLVNGILEVVSTIIPAQELLKVSKDNLKDKIQKNRSALKHQEGEHNKD
ncbi:MAG TPA: hypothetical protein DCZ97_06370 [Syntrophus sp. (in: bacteria)]|nr:hypothetical protein [Syntrophus sp. (in: bacteria)]